MMKKFILLSFIALASLAANAQLLWKVSGNGAKGDSYLFGTHHIAPVWLIDSIAPLKPALQGSDVMIGEIEFSDDPTAMQAAMMAHVIAPADSTLNVLFTPSQLDSLNVVLAKYTGGQLTWQPLNPMKPAMVGTQLSLLQTMTAFPEFNGSEQLDSHLQQLAREAGKPIGGFETPEFQFSLLMDYPLTEQAADLMDAVRHDDESIAKAHRLASAYMTQNLDSIASVLFEEEDNADSYDRLIFNRNDAWVKDLQERLPQQNVFVAVGVGHFVGPRGVLEQLRQLGYTLQPCK